MIRAMLDTDQPLQMTFTTGLLATYADLLDAPVLEHLTQVHGQVIAIDRGLGDPAHLATILDVEAHAAGPAGAPVWYDAQHSRGRRFLTVYCDRSTLPEVTREMGARPFYRWVARLDGIAHVEGFTAGQTPAAVQVLGSASLGFHADLSLVYQAAWNPAPAGMNLAAINGALATAATAIKDAQADLARVK